VPDELDALREALRDLLDRRSDSAAVRAAAASPRGYDGQLWQMLCGMGVAGLAVPEQYGGAAAGSPAVAVVAEELGRNLTPAPFLGSSVLATELLVALGDEAACARLLPGLAAGTSVAALCWSDADGTWDVPPVTARAGRVDGTAHYVLDGDTADVLLAVARDDGGVGVYEITGSEVERRHTPTMDLTRRLATVTFDGAAGVRVGSGDARPALERARRSAWVALAAEQVGSAAAALAHTVAYTAVREQFGRPIGSFQALKHRMADVHVAVSAARSAARAAASGEVDPVVAVQACSDAFRLASAEMIQLHGGIAITWEHDAHLYFKRAHGADQLLGRPAERMHALARLAGVAR
jgi:alkylation response protein AidB-like acyl-CoA dehydrogenase